MLTAIIIDDMPQAVQRLGKLLSAGANHWGGGGRGERREATEAAATRLALSECPVAGWNGF